ncbi:hypothetical protein PI124_g22789 [Phytophthora idaei]|nr:hypothetical protein PI124_g22789 [Phytophthora idaei]
MAKESTTVPATPSKSGGARNESSSPGVTAARLAAISELSLSFEDEEEHSPDAQDDYDDYEDKMPVPEPGAATPETATLSPGLSGATKSFSRNLATELDDVAGPDPDYEDFDDGAEGSKPSVASAKRSALLNAPRPPINGDTPAAQRVFDRVEALMRNDAAVQANSQEKDRLVGSRQRTAIPCQLSFDEPSRGGLGLAAASAGV